MELLATGGVHRPSAAACFSRCRDGHPDRSGPIAPCGDSGRKHEHECCVLGPILAQLLAKSDSWDSEPMLGLTRRVFAIRLWLRRRCWFSLVGTPINGLMTTGGKLLRTRRASRVT
jgi:hypothetical protein